MRHAKPESRKLLALKGNLYKFESQRKYAAYLRTEYAVKTYDRIEQVPEELIAYYRPTMLAFFEEYGYDGQYTLDQMAYLLGAKLQERYNELLTMRALINAWTKFRPDARVSGDRMHIEVIMGGKVIATIG